MYADSLETLYPLILNETEVADATYLQLRKSELSGRQIVTVRMGEWLVELEGVHSLEDLEGCSRSIRNLEFENRANDVRAPHLDEVEAERDTLKANGIGVLDRLSVIANLLEEKRLTEEVFAKSGEAIERCKQIVQAQKAVMDEHQKLIEQSERRIVLSRAKLALCNNDSGFTEAQLVRMFEGAMQEMRAKRFAWIDEKAAINEQELVLRNVDQRLAER